mmetsp:Transcript_25366/g.45931  ORF Transcript_25366/g.45931 Transcript_25366/m.45931 type:complete len:480 (-) Transcript_25366:42-1481(-)|eukprot:CAMPEP_0198295938 /NCGR_PEP_ID=MMETSP1449-20131203/30203_1 /TAXON_ID=420275 /ORGANISM="Attheya septentrionalis, Strain CCMP2084" /LENGTH=479 /DNA_ID=CAMNT_0043996377 /DNA_START=140 /DNA_END=1579 /DNA_ORIENTATION=+
MKWVMLSVGALVAPASVEAFVGPNQIIDMHSQQRHGSMRLFSATDTDTNTDAMFSAFADSLDEETLEQQFDSDDDDASSSSAKTTWQESLESLLNPTTPMSKRQIVLTDLLNANEAIQSSIQTAIKERKIDPLLTPTGKKLQDGTRAVARQITTDILPGIAEEVAASSSSSSSSMKNKKLPRRPPQEFTKIGNRVLNAISSQARKNLELLQGDLANPTRIPERLQKQTAELANEARNVFMETPEGLVGPPYKVLVSSSTYEIREYEGYAVASTSMSKVDEPYSMDDVASGGAAFNALAAYLFGANEEEKSMEMTTPVATTSLGEMRFYLRNNKENDTTMTIADFPEPLMEPLEDDLFNSRGAVRLVEVPPARLAVARFTGFVTEGEVTRQKDVLLSSLAMDGIEIDVPHGAVVPHVVFQYNPPYTIPMLRRNEIAVPVLDSYSPSDLEAEWGNLNGNTNNNDDDDESKNDDNLSPSDVE